MFQYIALINRVNLSKSKTSYSGCDAFTRKSTLHSNGREHFQLNEI